MCNDFGLSICKSKICALRRGPFKYYVSKEVGGWGQKMAIFADIQYVLLKNILQFPSKSEGIYLQKVNTLIF